MLPRYNGFSDSAGILDSLSDSPESPDSPKSPDSPESPDSPNVRITKYWQNVNTMSKSLKIPTHVLDMYGHVVPIQSVCGDVKLTLGRIKEHHDFNNLTLAYEDGTQVRQTESSSLHPVHN